MALLDKKRFFKSFNANPPAPESAIKDCETKGNIRLPGDYAQFLRETNGGEGFIGRHYLILWKAEELDQLNRAYQICEYAPGFLMFGSDGGGDGFAFDTRSSPYRVMEVPFIGMSLDDAFVVADNFTKLLERMVETDAPLF